MQDFVHIVLILEESNPQMVAGVSPVTLEDRGFSSLELFLYQKIS